MSTGEKHLHGDRPAYLSACYRLTRFRPPAQLKESTKMDKNANLMPRVIGFDCHPDTFTAALLQGPTPAAAVTEKIFNQVPLAQLAGWAKKQTTVQDLFVLEASGNSFQVVRTLAALDRKALVLESCQMGKLKEAHANNDKISAVRIGRLIWPARPRPSGCPTSKPRNGATGSMPTARPSSAARKCATASSLT